MFGIYACIYIHLLHSFCTGSRPKGGSYSQTGVWITILCASPHRPVCQNNGSSLLSSEKKPAVRLSGTCMVSICLWFLTHGRSIILCLK
uniref:Secreted protein n=1 Tax=Zea mays TaxID=4577 RepID=B6UC02_MAIZE|nr:hypothetical protein [Zea mays]